MIGNLHLSEARPHKIFLVREMVDDHGEPEDLQEEAKIWWEVFVSHADEQFFCRDDEEIASGVNWHHCSSHSTREEAYDWLGALAVSTN